MYVDIPLYSQFSAHSYSIANCVLLSREFSFVSVELSLHHKAIVTFKPIHISIDATGSHQLLS